MTTYSDAITIVHRLKVWIADERMGDGALLKAAADLIERQAAELAALRAQLADAERKIERLKFHAGGMAYCCEALEMALTKAASIYANRVTLNIDDFLPLTKAYAAYRADVVSTNWEGCHTIHPECAAWRAGREAGLREAAGIAGAEATRLEIIGKGHPDASQSRDRCFARVRSADAIRDAILAAIWEKHD